jgi:hypothetical protein
MHASNIAIAVIGVCAACASGPRVSGTGLLASRARLKDASATVVMLDRVSEGGGCHDRRTVSVEPGPSNARGQDSELWKVSRCGTVARYRVTYVPVPPDEPMPKAARGVEVQREP